MKETGFDKYVNLLRKRAWECAKRTGVEYSEIESQAFLVYCECLEKYDVNKSGFSTYLYIQLNRLYDFAKTYKRQKGIFLDDAEGDCEEDNVEYSDTLVAPEVTPNQIELLKDASKYLSSGALDLLKWIVSRDWEQKYKPTPTIKMAMKFFNKSQDVIEGFWEECKLYWNNIGIALYA